MGEHGAMNVISTEIVALLDHLTGEHRAVAVLFRPEAREHLVAACPAPLGWIDLPDVLRKAWDCDGYVAPWWAATKHESPRPLGRRVFIHI